MKFRQAILAHRCCYILAHSALRSALFLKGQKSQKAEYRWEAILFRVSLEVEPGQRYRMSCRSASARRGPSVRPNRLGLATPPRAAGGGVAAGTTYSPNFMMLADCRRIRNFTLRRKTTGFQSQLCDGAVQLRSGIGLNTNNEFSAPSTFPQACCFYIPQVGRIICRPEDPHLLAPMHG